MVTNINKTNNYLSSQLIEHKKNKKIYGVGNLSLAWDRHKKCGGVKQVNGILTLPS
jgi:hypothetical protein